MPFSPTSTSMAFVSHTSIVQFISSPLSPSPSPFKIISSTRRYQSHSIYSRSSLYSSNSVVGHSFLNQKPIMMSSLLPGVAVALLTPILALGILILLRVLFPTILTHPWTLSPKNSQQQKRDKERTVVFAGSFNPPHWGHLVMIKYLAERYGSVICCIGFNPSKRYDVTAQQRADILKGMISSNDILLNNVRVDVVSGYIWRHARAKNAKLFFRGIRTWAEDGADELKLLIQNTYGPMLLGRIWPINTIFLEADPMYRGVSSTLVRSLCGRIKEGHDKEGALEELKQLVPESVVDEVVEIYGK